MNLLKDVPIHQITQKINSKKASTGKSCQIHQFTIEQILNMIGDGNCAYTGEPFANLEDVTFERVNPKVGYVDGNVVMVSRVANQHKAQLDSFMHRDYIPDAMKIKLLRKALYQLEKGMK